MHLSHFFFCYLLPLSPNLLFFPDKEPGKQCNVSLPELGNCSPCSCRSTWGLVESLWVPPTLQEAPALQEHPDQAGLAIPSKSHPPSQGTLLQSLSLSKLCIKIKKKKKRGRKSVKRSIHRVSANEYDVFQKQHALTQTLNKKGTVYSVYSLKTTGDCVPVWEILVQCIVNTK